MQALGVIEPVDEPTDWVSNWYPFLHLNRSKRPQKGINAFANLQYVHSGEGSSTDIRRYYLLCPQHKKLLLAKSDWMMPHLSTQHPRLLSADSSF